MPNEMWWSTEGLDVAKIRDQTNQVTEEDVKRTDEQAKQAKQAQADIKQSKDKNTKVAKFLAFLLKHLKNEALVKSIHQTFFRARDPRTNITFVRKSINHMVVAGLFVPFFKKEAESFDIWPMFQTFTPEQIKHTADYIPYLKKLSGQYHDNIPLDRDSLLQLLLLINEEFIGSNSDQTYDQFKIGLFGS